MPVARPYGDSKSSRRSAQNPMSAATGDIRRQGRSRGPRLSWARLRYAASRS